MYRVTVLYGVPAAPEEFDTYYRQVHIPLARKMRGLKRWTITPVTSRDGSSGPGYYLIADLYADDRAAMETVLASDEGRAARDDVANFATGGAVFLEGYEEEIVLG